MDEPTSKALLSIAYLPDGGFVLPLITSLRRSRVPQHGRALERWKDCGLGLHATSLSTKLSMLRHIVPNLGIASRELLKGLPHGDDLEHYLENGVAWVPESRGSAYTVLLAVDEFIFEFRSAYEILGKFVRIFCREVFAREATEAEILAHVERDHPSVEWVAILREHRKLFFHEQAPWLALRFHNVDKRLPEIVILPHAGPRAEQVPTLAMSDLQRILAGFSQAIDSVQTWLLQEIQQSKSSSGTA